MLDPRDIRTGSRIPAENYADQPFVVVLPDGTWLCVLTTGRGKEGERGQHVVATRSTDQGQTWSKPVDIEPADGPEASWAVPLLVPGGRVYAFYDYNGDRVEALKGRKIRADMLGWYVYKYSDDGGRTWSPGRRRLPMRLTACDRANQWEGRVQVFWGVSKPIVAGASAYFAFTKLGRYLLDQGEGWVWRSDNILTESDVSKLRWEMLPEGDAGIRAPEFGSVQEEHNLVALSDGALYGAYRTTTGCPCFSISRDGGRTWSKPEVMAYADGRKMKNPRANPRLWRTAGGKYLFWYHNHGGKTFEDRNPAWVAGGVEKDGRILWSEPEVLLYAPDPKTRMSYPDLVEQDGRYWVTETQKSAARVHEVDGTLLEGLWNQFENRRVAERGLALNLAAGRSGAGAAVALPRLPHLGQGGGFSLDVWLHLGTPGRPRTILDARDDAGRGIALLVSESDRPSLVLGDGRTTAVWEGDEGSLAGEGWRHVVATVDGGPKIITFIVDGRLCDGGEARPFGWGRFDAAMGDVNGRREVRLGEALGGLRIYGRCLRTSEAAGNFRAGR